MDVRLRYDRWRCALDTRTHRRLKPVAVHPVGAAANRREFSAERNNLRVSATERKKKTICHNLTLAGAAARKQSAMKAY